MKTETDNSVQDQNATFDNNMLPAVNFQFLYRKKRNQEDAQSFDSKKKNIKEAMDDFLTRKRNLFDIEEEVEVTYEDGKTEFIQIDARQDKSLCFG